MKRNTCVAAVIVGVALLLAACSPPPVEELNKPFSSGGFPLSLTKSGYVGYNGVSHRHYGGFCACSG
jgi:hypothetical protein